MQFIHLHADGCHLHLFIAIASGAACRQDPGAASLVSSELRFTLTVETQNDVEVVQSLAQRVQGDLCS